MPDQPADLQRRLDELAARLARIERHLHLTPVLPETDQPPAPDHPTPEHTPGTTLASRLVDAAHARRHAANTPADAASPPAPPKTPPTHAADAPTSAADAPALAATPPTRPTAAPARVGPPPAAPPRTAARASDTPLEVLLGGRVAAVIGAIVVLVGVGVGVKYAWDQGWIGLISPTARCLLSAAFGLALVITGEITRRRLGRVAALGLLAAGLGVWYLTSYAAFALGLVGHGGGMLLLSLVAVASFAMTWRARSTAIGVLSLLAALATPIFFGDPVAGVMSIPLYVTMLIVVALGLAGLDPRAFSPLRWIVLAGSAFLGLGWLLGGPAGVARIALPFAALWWGLFAVEGVWTASHRRSGVANAAISILTTTAFVTAGCWILQTMLPAGDPWLGLFTLAVGVFAAALAFQFGGGLAALQQRPQRASEILAAAHWFEAGALLIIAAALQFDGVGQTISWLAMAVVAIEAGRRIGSTGVSIFGLAVGALAGLRIVAIDSTNPVLLQTIVELGAFTITTWTLLAAAGMGVTIHAARRIAVSDHGAPLALRVVLTTIAALAWVVICGVAALPDGLAAATGWLIGAAALLLVDRFAARARESVIALGLIGFALLWWFIGVPAVEAAARPDLGLDRLALLLAALGLTWWAAVRISALRLDRSAAYRPAWVRVNAIGESLLIAAWALLVLAVAIQIEIVLRQGDPAAFVWPRGLTWFFWSSIVLAAGGVASQFAAAHLGVTRLAATAGGFVFIGAVGWLATGPFSISSEGFFDAGAVINLQSLSGLALGAAALLIGRPRPLPTPSTPRERVVARLFRPASWLCLALIVLWSGSLEIHRAFHDTGLNLSLLSVYWGVFAVGAVVMGFRLRVAPARYAGLALLAITVVKVLIIDMAGVGQIWRVMSTVVVGLLVLAVSVGYGRIAPKLLGGAAADRREA